MAESEMIQFQEQLLERGVDGGAEAAQRILDAVQRYISNFDMSQAWRVVVRMFANIDFLTRKYQSEGIMRDESTLRHFALGFTQSQPLFEIIDAGHGKERVDYKVKGQFANLHNKSRMRSCVSGPEHLNLFAANRQCKHVFLGCCHDPGYAATLEPYKANEAMVSRLTLLEPSRFGWQYTDLPFATTSMNSNVFREPGQIVKPANPRSSKITSLNSTRSSSISSSNHSSTIKDIMISPNRPVYPVAVLLNKNNERLDGMIGKLDPQASESIKQHLNRQNLCLNFHLKGKCRGRNCNFSHDRRLSQDEVVALGKLIRRTTPCVQGLSCRSTVCMYGHSCPHTPCNKGSTCPFARFHGKDLHLPKSSPSAYESRGRRDHETRYEHDLRVLNEEPLVEFERGQAPIETDRYPVLKPSVLTVTEKTLPPKTPAVLAPSKG